jgi:hypothetical protein
MSEMEEGEIKGIVENKSDLSISRTGTLMPKGKLFGMDAFVWLYPGVGTLSSTIESFPFDVVWIGNCAEMEAILEQNPKLETKVLKYLIIGESTFKNDKCLFFSDVNLALKSIKENSKKPGIILFTSTDSNTEYTNRQINNFLELVQIQ